MNHSEYAVRPESPGDIGSIRDVHRRAFGRDDEAALVDALRDGGFARLSLVAELDDQVVGHVLFTRMYVVAEASRIATIALAPLAVLPEYQRRGIGAQLVNTGLARLSPLGESSVLVVGDPAYYGRFGFNSRLARSIASPFPEHLMALELTPGAMRDVVGRVEYPEPFGIR